MLYICTADSQHNGTADVYGAVLRYVNRFDSVSADEALHFFNVRMLRKASGKHQLIRRRLEAAAADKAVSISRQLKAADCDLQHVKPRTFRGGGNTVIRRNDCSVIDNAYRAARIALAEVCDPLICESRKYLGCGHSPSAQEPFAYGTGVQAAILRIFRTLPDIGKYGLIPKLCDVFGKAASAEVRRKYQLLSMTEHREIRMPCKCRRDERVIRHIQWDKSHCFERGIEYFPVPLPYYYVRPIHASLSRPSTAATASPMFLTLISRSPSGRRISSRTWAGMMQRLKPRRAISDRR